MTTILMKLKTLKKQTIISGRIIIIIIVKMENPFEIILESGYSGANCTPHSGAKCTGHSGANCTPHSGLNCTPHSGAKCTVILMLILGYIK